MAPFKKYNYVILLLACLIPAIGISQVKLSERPDFITVSSMYGSFQVHTPKIDKYRGVNPYSFELEWSRWYLSREALEASGTFSRLTLRLGYTDFNHPDLGYAVQALASVEPFLLVRPNFRLSLKGGFGVTSLSKIYHPQTNPDNLIFSSHIAFPLSVGTGFYYMVQPRLGLKAEASFRHISNGGLSQPNLGINYYALSLGLEYALNSYELPEKNRDVQWEKENRFELVGGFTLKEDTSHVNNKSVAMLIAQRFWQTSRINGITGGIMLDYQEATQPGDEALSSGIFAGHEFLIGRFRFGQQMGVYFLRGTDPLNQLFQNYYLRWHSKRQWLWGVHLKAHGHVADFLAFQVGLKFNQ